MVYGKLLVVVFLLRYGLTFEGASVGIFRVFGRKFDVILALVFSVCSSLHLSDDF